MEKQLAFDAYARLMEQGHRFNSVGKHREALSVHREALGLCEEKFGLDSPSCLTPIIRTGVELSNLARFNEAKTVFDRAEAVLKRAGAQGQFPEYATARAIHLANAGLAGEALDLARESNRRRGEALKVIMARPAHTAQARQILARAFAELAHGLLVQANLTLLVEDFERAKVTAQLARAIMGKVAEAPDWWVASSDELLAQISARYGKLEEGSALQQGAVLIKQASLGPTRYVAQSKIVLASILKAMGRQGEAIDSTRAAVEVALEMEQPVLGARPVEAALTVLSSDDSKPASNGGGSGLAPSSPTSSPNSVPDGGLLDSALAPPTPAERFFVAQFQRDGTTAEALSRTLRRLSVKDSELGAMIGQLARLEQARDTAHGALQREATRPESRRRPAQIKLLRKTITLTTERIDTLGAQIETRMPNFRQLQAIKPTPTKAVQMALAADEVLVRITRTGERGHVFAVTKDRVTDGVIPLGEAALAVEVAALKQAFEIQGGAIRPFDMERSQALYRTLLGPVEAQLAGKRHMILVVGGALLSLPPSLLVRRAASAEAYGRAHWLIDDLAVSIAPSVTSFVELRNRVIPSPAPYAMLGVGDPVFEGAAALRRGGQGMGALEAHCNRNSPVPAHLIRGLAPLPDTAKEVRQVARVLGVESKHLLLGMAAEERALRQIPFNRYRLLYFATHGLLPGELSCENEPGLALTAPLKTATETDQDGLLAASEIARLDLNADLVVLSACNTGAGAGGKFGGEALSGLANAFFYAGARSLLVSHWQVDSAATADMMVAFFENASTHADRRAAEAFQAAMLQTRTHPRRSHPFFWAGFTLIGDGGRALFSDKNDNEF